MHRFRILYLIISGCLAAIFSGCAVKKVDGFQEKALEQRIYKATYFSDPAIDYVYKAHISVYGNDLGGIFIAKQIAENTHRVAFTTEFGNKLFDFTLTDTDFTVNYILEELDRKIILNTLKKDFMLLFRKVHPIKEMYENSESDVYKSKDGNRYNYLFADKKSQNLTQIVNATKSKEKVIISFVPETNTLAKKIIINHKNIKLTIELDYLKK